MKQLYYYQTTLGRFGIGEDNGAITDLFLTDVGVPLGMEERETPLLKEAGDQLTAFCNGTRKTFDLPLAPKGTPFQQSVWQALQDIPYGETRSYKQIAHAVGSAKGYRAVGMANNRNPISIFIPCHRVIGASGELVGYGGGLELKRALLSLESLGWR